MHGSTDDDTLLLQTHAKSLNTGVYDLDENQAVYIENSAVFGAVRGLEWDALGLCMDIAPQHASNVDAPRVKVCGGRITATFFLRGRCNAYQENQIVVGTCAPQSNPLTCASFSPAQDTREGPGFGHYQSYRISQCPYPS